ncbi:hypothetical protein POX_e06237 [Penicillium oxalicum]|uniref:hypothetical protein n=1 Tax=Penicillium oxalicum TaxID=69781 RepID=UPI0020B7E8CE|nr:hypothetical protein POX_e06237 [Penicillium oxalicum]KAI2788224.1 hypothetical protein POX_e06237 [Penicillium oxalicum]
MSCGSYRRQPSTQGSEIVVKHRSSYSSVSKKLNPGLVPKPLHEKQAFPEDTYRVRFESRNICRHDQEESTNTLQRINTHTPSQVKVIRLWVALFFAGKAHERLPGLPRADGASRSTS